MSRSEEARVSAGDPGLLAGWTVFETILCVEGQMPALSLHLDRLSQSCAQAEIAFDRAVLEPEILDVAARTPGRARIRITLSGSGLRIVASEPVSLARFGAPVRCVRGPWVADPFLTGEVKHGSRAGWVVAVRRSGADDVLLVGPEGRFMEGTTCGILAVRGGALWTAPSDGRILQSTTVAQLVDLAERQGIRVVREGPPAAGPWDALYIASATRGLAPVIELDGEALPGMEPVGAQLLASLRNRA